MSDPIRYVATLVLAEMDKRILQKAIALVCGTQTASILSPGKAFDFEITGAEPKAAQNQLIQRMAATGIKADICVQPANNRRKSLLICDMDSTLIGQECIDELADFAGLKAEVSTITEQAMRGEIDFDDALKNRVKLMKGMPLNTLQTCFNDRIGLNLGARTLAMTMQVNGAHTVIVSGGFTFFTKRIAAQAGFVAHHANVLLDDGTALLGTVATPILGRQAKLDRLRAYAKPPLTCDDALAIGDGANDLAMIEAAGLGIAYYAKPTVAAAAHCAINHTDLTTALYFQGYTDAEFITD